jgi:hypothetical protein
MEFHPGSNFIKVWRIQNIGTCPWEPGTIWTFSNGNQMGTSDSVPAPSIAPGETADVSVSLIAPASPGDYTGNWQLLRPNGQMVGDEAFVRIHVSVTEESPTGTPTSPATASPTAAPSSGFSPEIIFFRANLTEADPGDSIMLEWETTGAQFVSVYHLLASGQLGEPFWEVEDRGSLTYAIQPTERNATRFVLFAGGGSQTIQATVTVTLRCPDTWFFSPSPDICPAQAALESFAAEQTFERGVMIWLQAQGRIYVLFSDGDSPHWNAHTDIWGEGDPEDDPALQPPPGFYQPVRGFGLIWRDEPSVRDRLGWAVGPESGFNGAYQVTSRSKYNDLFLAALDGGVWMLKTERSGWEKLGP